MTTAALSGPIEAETFRGIMSVLVAGVAVVTTVDLDGEPRGLTTTAVTSASLEPPLLLVCLAHDSRTLPAIRDAGRFAVNLVHARADELAARFASKDSSKFVDAAWRPGVRGAPILHEDAVAWCECELEREIEAGDHVLLLGRVEHGEVAAGEHEPLAYYRRRFGTWTANSSIEERSSR